MRDQSKIKTLQRFSLCAGLTLLLGGCATWTPTDLTPAQVWAQDRPTSVRVTTSDGARTILARVRLLGDVIAGFDQACYDRFGRDSENCAELGVPVFDIEVLEVKKRGPVALILPAVGGLAAVWLLVNR